MQVADHGSSSVELRSLWRPEYASYMVEGTPGGPYGGATNYFNTVHHIPVIKISFFAKSIGI